MANTLGAIRKAVDSSVASDVSRMAKLFAKICADNPEAVKAAFGAFLSKKSIEDQDRMVQFYADNADYIATLFDQQ